MNLLTLLSVIAILVVLALTWMVVEARRNPQPYSPAATFIIDNPIRRFFFDPSKELALFGVTPGMRVLEVGPGSGFYSRDAIEKVGASGELVCLDLQRQMLEQVREGMNGKLPGLVCANGIQLPFADESFDLVFFSTVLGEIPGLDQVLCESSRVLKKNGVLTVIEEMWDPDYVRHPVVLAAAQHAGLEAKECFGGSFRYTQRFVAL